MLTAWIALDDAVIGSGCLRYVHGSHQGPLLPHEAPRVEAQRREKGGEWSSSRSTESKAALAAACIDPSRLPGAAATTAVPVARGSVVFHHGSTAHCSGPNATARPRRAYSCHFAASTATARSSILDDSAPLQRALQTAAAVAAARPQKQAAAARL